MELLAVALARVASFLEVQALDPLGKTSTLDAFRDIGSRYSFAKVPHTLAEIDFQKGIELQAGNCNGIHVDKLTVYSGGIAVDTRSSTDECEKVLQDLLALVKEAFGATVMAGRKTFASQLIFRGEMRLTMLHPVLHMAMDRLADRVWRNLKHPYVLPHGHNGSRPRPSKDRAVGIPWNGALIELLEQLEASLSA